MVFPPDDYIASVLATAALNFIDLSSVVDDPFPLLYGALACYFVAFLVLYRVTPARADILAGSFVVAVLAVYWLVSDRGVNGDNKYFLRTALLIFTPAFGVMAAANALDTDDRLKLPVPFPSKFDPPPAPSWSRRWCTRSRPYGSSKPGATTKLQCGR